MAFIACKLPHGLTIRHKGREITLRGGNIGEDLENVSRNGRPNDNRDRVSGFGLTELSPQDTEAFVDWVNVVTYKDGKREAGKLDDPFMPLENGSIQGPFKSREEAAKEVSALADSVTTGVEGLDAEAEAKKAGGVQKAEDDEKGK